MSVGILLRVALAPSKPKNTTLFPRACTLRASAVIGLRCPDAGKLMNQIFIVMIPSPHVNGGRCLAQGDNRLPDSSGDKTLETRKIASYSLSA
jgi:hypothetical protein